jgi:hypothetical protein
VNHHRAVAGDGFRGDPLLGLSQEDQERAFRPCMLDRGPHQSVEQPFENHLARDRLRDGDDRRKVEVFDRAGGRGSRSGCGFFSPRAWVTLIDDLLQQRPHIEVDVCRRDLPPR